TPPARSAHGAAARDEDEADRQTLRDVVHGDRERDQEPERPAVAERDADADALRERVERHRADDQERTTGVCAAQRSEVELRSRLEEVAREGDEGGPYRDPE